MLQRAASNAYSWWWASHIRTKQSKWLDNNLQDMEEKVKFMIKLIEEDADSFAKKAEMYYKRRPELINFVQETYKAYRALAERYDHISGELHKANNTIATIFPDQHFGMEDEEDDSSPKATNKFRKAASPSPPQTVTPDKAASPPPLQTVTPDKAASPPPPQTVTPDKGMKSPKPQTKLKQKKTSSQKTTATNTTAATSSDKAKEEIDKLQKEILVLQTEKEFIKGSYESGLAKYWEIENKITEMQEKVCSLQDEYSADAVIEDDEARALMAATALKSCEDTLVKLHEQQKRSTEAARVESERIKNAKEKLGDIKRKYGQPQAEKHDSSEDASEDPSQKSLEEEVFHLKQDRLALQSVCEKIKENFKMNSEMSVLDLAEKIDELVSKVIALETTVSSQTAQIQRLKLETDELHKHLQALEEEKVTLIGDSKGLSDRVRHAEEELHRVQVLDRCVQDERGKLHTHFTEACQTFNDLSDKLQSLEKQEVVGSTKKEAVDCISLPREHNEKEKLDGLRVVQKVSEEKNLCTTGNELMNSTDGRVRVEALEDKAHAISGNNQDVNSGAVHIPEDIKEKTQDKKQEDMADNQIVPPQAAHELNVDRNQQTGGSLPDIIASGKSQDSQKEEEFENADLSQKDQNTLVNANHQNKIADNHDVPLPNWQQLFLDGLEDREKILLAEYTSILRSYKETKRKLTEAEKKSQDYLFETMSQIRDFKNAIVMKDEEIRSLRQKLDFLETSWLESSDAPCRLPSTRTGEASWPSGSLPDHSTMPNSETPNDQNVKQIGEEDRKPGEPAAESLVIEGEKVHPIDEERNVPPIEEKFRRDIDELLEENLEFWLRFSSSFQQIQKYQTTVQDLQAEITKLMDTKKQEGSSTSHKEHSVKSEASSIHKQLGDLQTDLSVWIEQNGLLKEELHCRFSSLCNIKEEITRVSKEGVGVGVQFTAYQASKFHGEVINMQQENNKVADELQAGLDHVKSLQDEVEKLLAKLNENFEISTSKSHHHNHFKNFSNKTRVPLRSFLFGGKPKKQSIFSCMNPAMQKQFSDLRAALPK